MYLNREPLLAEIGRFSAMYSEQGFLGCVGAVDWMHLYWMKGSGVMKGQYHNSKEGKIVSISCEDGVDSDL